MDTRQAQGRPPDEPDEPDRVHAWRAHLLIRAGYPTAVALTLADRRDVDVHQALDLLDHGCTPETAAAILL